MNCRRSCKLGSSSSLGRSGISGALGRSGKAGCSGTTGSCSSCGSGNWEIPGISHPTSDMLGVPSTGGTMDGIGDMTGIPGVDDVNCAVVNDAVDSVLLVFPILRRAGLKIWY